MNEAFVKKRLEIIEDELKALKQLLKDRHRAPRKTLRGVWKGLDITEEDIEEAKRSLFRQGLE